MVGQPCALGGPIPIPLVVELQVEFPQDFAEDDAGFGEEEPSGSEQIMELVGDVMGMLEEGWLG